MDKNRYKVETVEKYRAVIKKFYKLVYGKVSIFIYKWKFQWLNYCKNVKKIPII